jgi:hypothetical protein
VKRRWVAVKVKRRLRRGLALFTALTKSLACLQVVPGCLTPGVDVAVANILVGQVCA